MDLTKFKLAALLLAKGVKDTAAGEMSQSKGGQWSAVPGCGVFSPSPGYQLRNVF